MGKSVDEWVGMLEINSAGFQAYVGLSLPHIGGGNRPPPPSVPPPPPFGLRSPPRTRPHARALANVRYEPETEGEVEAVVLKNDGAELSVFSSIVLRDRWAVAPAARSDGFHIEPRA